LQPPPFLSRRNLKTNILMSLSGLS
jgi:hypothetical protein